MEMICVVTRASRKTHYLVAFRPESPKQSMMLFRLISAFFFLFCSLNIDPDCVNLQPILPYSQIRYMFTKFIFIQIEQLLPLVLHYQHLTLTLFQKDQQKTYGLGTIKFTLSYDFGSQTLLVKIIKADGLPAMDIGGTSDPFVKVKLTF